MVQCRVPASAGDMHVNATHLWHLAWMPQKKREWEGLNWVLHNVPINTLSSRHTPTVALVFSHISSLFVAGMHLTRFIYFALELDVCAVTHPETDTHNPLVDDCLPLYVPITITQHWSVPLFCTVHFRPSFARHVHISKNILQELFILSMLCSQETWLSNSALACRCWGNQCTWAALDTCI